MNDDGGNEDVAFDKTLEYYLCFSCYLNEDLKKRYEKGSLVPDLKFAHSKQKSDFYLFLLHQDYHYYNFHHAHYNYYHYHCYDCHYYILD